MSETNRNHEELYISAVLPVHNEEGNLREMHERLTATLVSLDKPFEIIYVENRSTDNTVKVLRSLMGAKVIILRLPQMGNRTTQSIALDAGIKAATGKFIVTLDSDLQNPPEEIPKLLAKLIDEDLDVVSGWRQKRQDNIIIKSLSKFGSLVRSRFLNPGVHDLGCTLKVYRRECFENVDLYGEMHRYLVAVLRWQGFAVGEMVVKHEARKSGRSAYNWKKAFRGFADMWLIWFWKKYSDRPLHLFGVAGIFLALGGVGLLVLLAVLRFLNVIALAESIWPMVGVLMIVTGTQLFVFGMTIDLVIRTYFAVGREKPYLIKEAFTV
jgi:glycosyltransferase involved in cell wall biosynthesis